MSGQPLALYDVVVNGHKTQMNLSEAEAERLGATRVGEDAPATKVAKAPRNKARTAEGDKAE